MLLTYKGAEIRLSRTADREMVDHRIYMVDVVNILREGVESGGSKRRRGTIEKTMKVRGKRIKVVAVESISRWNGELVWLIVHVGDTSER